MSDDLQSNPDTKDSHKPVATQKYSSPPRKVRLVGVKTSNYEMVFRFSTTLRQIRVDDWVLLQLNKEDEDVGRVLYVSEEKPGESIQDRVYMGNFNKIVKVLSGSERKMLASREEMEKLAKAFCREQIKGLKLEMKLSRVRYVSLGNKAIFYFTAENRVDFRELVRLLGSRLKIRVEMRHVGVRDETKLLGGLGSCGQAFCCSRYLQKFHPVSVRMAKNQDLSLNPEGISGVCGRLLCCLAFENETYKTLRAELPKPKSHVWTLDGKEAVVNEVHTLAQKVGVQFEGGVRAMLPNCELCRKKPIIAEKSPPLPEEVTIKPDKKVIPSEKRRTPHKKESSGLAKTERKPKGQPALKTHSPGSQQKSVQPTSVQPTSEEKTTTPTSQEKRRRRRRRKRSGPKENKPSP